LHIYCDSNYFVISAFCYLLTMFLCYVCGEEKSNFSRFRAHINDHASDYELTRPIACCQNGCRCMFTQTYNFFRHVKSYHMNDNGMCAGLLTRATNSEDTVRSLKYGEFDDLAGINDGENVRMLRVLTMHLAM
jgi:hypothetical protein